MNKNTTPSYSTLLRNKLGKLATDLQSRANPSGSNTDLITLEGVISESIKILSKFYKELNEPSFVPKNVIVDTPPLLEEYNENFAGINSDLDIVYSEFENLEGVVLGNFNYMVSRLNRLNKKLKIVSSKMGDYILYTNHPTADTVFFSDSFNNLSRIEVDSPLLNNEQCEINQVEGIITLPADRDSQESILISKVPIINSNSNGTAGNNEEIGAELNANISDILDNNADTWFEYERVLRRDDGDDLVLDFTVNLGEKRIINFIRVNPNNFGTRTQVKITAIDTSVDGQEFVSIKDDIPIAGFIAQDEENVFTLAPSTSKFAGQGLYTFTPREAKYVRLNLKQTTAYKIKTVTGEKFRYAIGIRDIDIQAIPYKAKGEIVSTEYSAGDEIKKVVLLSNQNPDPATTSKLASIKHYISPDNGVTWYQIRPKVSVGLADVKQQVPELLDFNGVMKNSIETASPVKSLRYKALLEKDTAAFLGDSSELAQEIDYITELHTPPSTTPMTINLQNVPIDGSIRLVDPQYGSRGIDGHYYNIAQGTGNLLKIDLAFDIKKDYEKVYSYGYFLMGTPPGVTGYYTNEVDPQTIYVDGDEWTNELSPNSTSTDKHYRLDFANNTLEFGDGTTGKAVPNGSTISMKLQEERLCPGRGPKHIAKLDYPTVADKGQVEIDLVSPMVQKTVRLKPGATIHQVDKYICNDLSYLPSFSTGFELNNKVNTEGEVTSAGKWYIDYDKGYIRSYDRTSSSTPVTATYYYTPRRTLTEDEWDFIDADEGVTNAISISDNAYVTYTVEDYPEKIDSETRHISLANLAIVEGTLSFTSPSGVIQSGVYLEEVPYIDGVTELMDTVKIVDEIAAITTVTEGVVSNILINLNLSLSTDSNLPVQLSDAYHFERDVTPLVPASGGDYSIDRTTSQITARLSQNIPAFEVVYHHINPQADLTGKYSVNYKSGEVFLHDITGGADTVSYEYTNYVIRYPIAREISSRDWKFDKATNQITIKDREILRSMRIPQTISNGITSLAKYYQVSYKYVKSSRPNVEELAPYFTPVLKDYALRIITSSRLV